MTEIYLIRHTQAEGNRYRMMQGFWDGEVTEKGKHQIEELAKRFEHVPLDAVYSSDLSRAVMTADAAARWKNLPIQTSTALRELNIGPWEQKFFGNLSYEEPELTNRFIFDAENWHLEGAETFAQVRARALAELKKIAEENAGKTVAVASHGATIRCIMSGITGIPLTDVKRLPIFKNTAVTKLLWDGERFQVEYMNDASHLPPEAQSSWNTSADLRDEILDPSTDWTYYEACYSDAWSSAHGSLHGYNPDTYLSAALRHHAKQPGSVMRICQWVWWTWTRSVAPRTEPDGSAFFTSKRATGTRAMASRSWPVRSSFTRTWAGAACVFRWRRKTQSPAPSTGARAFVSCVRRKARPAKESFS